ncbi:multidrug efflux SMR transporter [Viridibacillus sp. FSL R5-0477]|uniref:Small multidrug resistance protein, SMR family n=1 Tax=Viridibacillus arenosi FSL R5-213 TaxID=1227360 RepID=W4ERW1_9BACL|nr:MULTISPECIES: multidrug efflux SMR transporter [Viridibacillus]ETT82999.1 small multidrug resistance protein, SMR family [Viridibacillus arenosi FSL R5-213]OMC82060.1 QacE family quaternary ammonium compound efflux SMR transporter [Viridibacillus sp. FSL H8-0123]OMC86218.1 QacE family quaternary ammonium compound efflux SMR transporter [Viridibacillus sp. FSL H7-0596]OMC90879.1 QacE family quaternary ammonium compound efflux SMR transporter [Viridibacillus arenosi]
MAWIALIVAGFCEVFGVAMMNKWQYEKKATIMISLIAGFTISFSCLSYAMNTIPMGTAYAIWTGIGASGGALIGIFFFGESKDWKRIVFITMVLSAAVGLKLVS